MNGLPRTSFPWTGKILGGLGKKKVATTPSADICLIVEGTYPYVAGGVSGWVHELIKSLPEFSFHLLALLAPNQKLQTRYDLPKNVSGITHLFLAPPRGGLGRGKSVSSLFADLEPGLAGFQEEGGIEPLRRIVATLAPFRRELAPGWLLNSRPGWDLLLRLYDRLLPGGPFLDFFWTWRYLSGNLFTILLRDLPRARVYHAVSTGYAGLCLARARMETGRPVIVCEHGIYTNERRIEITMAEWLYEDPNAGLQLDHGKSDCRKLWIHAFQAYSLACYQACEEIITIYGGNQDFQKADGADPSRMRVIPNGIDWRRFENLVSDKGTRPPTIALIGRVVPIKDIKGFIQACAILRQSVPNARAMIMGPTEEDEDYYEECLGLVHHFHLQEMIEFTGRVNLVDYLGRIDVLVLTSISEGQPLVILEAGAAGVPTVATDVGACREMILGMPDEDPPLGPAGAVTRVSSPSETAHELVRLLTQPAWWRQCSQAIRQRVKKYYDQGTLTQTYRELYTRLCHLPSDSEPVRE
ncbi:MAG: GT4 family glycosyltransferase PelF [Magnetococcales bacterium]|nr:GT4 family glycosyltransferase PelF [Magnetococcales bacterium]